MSEILDYKNNENVINNLSIKRLRDFPIYYKDFVTFVTNSIKDNYDEIDESFAKILIEIDKKGFDNYGFFTLGKDIWIC